MRFMSCAAGVAWPTEGWHPGAMTSLMYDSIPPAPVLGREQLEAVAARVAAAGASLAQARSVPAEVMALVRELPGLLHADDPARAFGGTDPYLAEAVYAAVASA